MPTTSLQSGRDVPFLLLLLYGLRRSGDDDDVEGRGRLTSPSAPAASSGRISGPASASRR